MNELQNKLEGKLITRTFHVGGMPEKVFKEVDSFCKEYYGDSRWTMIADLHRAVRDDYKYNLLYDELQVVKQELAEINALFNEPKEPVIASKRKIPTFGRQEEDE